MLRILLYALFINCSLQAQQPFTPAHPDVQHYEFQIAVSDSSDRIEGAATIQCLIVTPGNQLTFDLTGPRPNGHGMLVKSVNGGSQPLEFKQENDRLSIYFKKPLRKEEKTSIRIAYEGIPDDGLIIARNKFGDRGFFADNWPKRAHDWIPCIDHPADKAMVDFIIKAPAHYQVVAN
ncbi:MAG TPA: M1 family peptidase, partial [Chitinophagaceae bacterium]|nr:M1 family peptidase [Chitinophagaceae bacterium]